MTGQAADTKPVLTGLMDRFESHNAPWDSNDPKTQQHHQRRQQLALQGLGNKVAVTDRGHRDDRPIHALPHGLELGVGVTALKSHHQVTENHLSHHHEEQKHTDAASAGLQSTSKHLGFIHETQQLENTQHPSELENPEDQSTVDLRHKEEERRREVDQTKKLRE